MNWLFLILFLNVCELTACLSGFIHWNKIKNTYWKYFPFYLGIIFLTEITAEYFLYVLHDLTTNVAIYRFWGLQIQFAFFYWLFYKQLKESKFFKLPFICGVIYLLSWIAEQFWLRTLYPWFDSFSYSIGCILLLIQLLAFIPVFTRSSELINIRQSMIFWTCLGLLIFYIGSLPFWALRGLMYAQFEDLFTVYFVIQYLLNYTMYLLFAIAFKWGHPN